MTGGTIEHSAAAAPLIHPGADPLARLRADPLARLRADARRRDADGLRRTLSPRGGDHDGLIDLASNDYLGLCRDPRLAAGAVAAVREYGTGATGSRLVTGTTDLHAELDRRLAAFTGTGAGLVFSSGYLANLGAVAALGGPDVLVISDRTNHASIVDACRLSRSRVVITPHRDVTAVERALAERGEPHALVVTDAVFSVDGDVAPLAALHRAARAHGALLVIDEAHALGVVGDGGRGAAHAAGIAGEPDVVLTLTLSKALASQGGAVLGAPEVVETLVDASRAFIFDTGLNPAAAGAALAALDVLAAEPDLPGRARDRARRIAALTAGSGLTTTPDPAAAVVPVVLGAPEDALHARDLCRKNGLKVGCFRPPSVPAGRSCLRLTARATLDEAELTVLGGALEMIARSTGRSLHT
ncbi:aminotransferase class I/II-fold pyridoxal phosphate-dependent enzyme [Actinomadura harenae]|uniref:8-amino-7-oxononanoate synthase n=1 Tax=Actinomadura harenae TaxID=2483351 RepID=A0A3M2LKF6_9ACTN|nr:aminotransferase class I/II-fold pyridoxal phosphate-dependent enzyme [Actinomadura harenae]RMI37969.1 aminotransferase class I/II-fold pyridoxal phosphate-dependent enzyme [Actinomadura harenae]